MSLLLIRRFLELFIFSAIPGFFASIIIQYDNIQGILFYPVLISVSIICASIFFGGNALMMRRMVRDIESKEKYLFVQWTAFVIYSILIACVCIFGWKDIRVAMFFHSRVFEVIADPIIVDPTDYTKNLITPTQSMIISTILYGVMTALSYNWFKTRYDREVEENKRQEEAEYQAAKEARRKYKEEQERKEKAIRDGISKNVEDYEEEHRRQRERAREWHRRMKEEENRLYTVKELKKMERKDFNETVATSSRKRNTLKKSTSGEKLKTRLKNSILEAGSYEFYQRFIDKAESGGDAWGFARTYWKRRISPGFYLRKTRKYK